MTLFYNEWGEVKFHLTSYFLYNTEDVRTWDVLWEGIGRSAMKSMTLDMQQST